MKSPFRELPLLYIKVEFTTVAAVSVSDLDGVSLGENILFALHVFLYAEERLPIMFLVLLVREQHRESDRLNSLVSLHCFQWQALPPAWSETSGTMDSRSMCRE